jgi:cytochrome c oxidase assembly factor CtaG
MDKFITAVSEHILNPLIYLLFIIAFLVFIWGIVRFIAKGGEEEVRSTAKRHILYGLLGMFIMFSAFSLIRLITGSLGIKDADKVLNSLER